ncbi:YceI family protein [Streptosporangium sp. NPDC000239]|uniref:YceI family protein n=1 Tax=Streptosporangium sp. NPDC000239 TaxID=3154248 RepID=UPI00331BB85C
MTHSATVPEPGTWLIDPANSSVTFAVGHMLVSRITGRFNRFDGHVTVGRDLSETGVTATLAAGSIDTNHPERDLHLRGGKFLDAGTYPQITYRSSTVRGSGTDYVIGGDLTVKATTLPVELRLTYGGVTDDPLGHRRAGFLGRARFSRAAFGVAETMGLMRAGGPVVGDTVHVFLNIEAILEDSHV